MHSAHINSERTVTTDKLAGMAPTVKKSPVFRLRKSSNTV